MNLAELPLTLLLILPGFLVLQVAFLVSRIRRISAFNATMWSLLLSFLLFVAVYLPYAALISPPMGLATWPSFRDALVSPQSLPGGVWIVLYVSAIGLGWGFGKLEGSRVPRRLLLLLRIDLSRHGSIWERAFEENDSCEVFVYTADGRLFLGWPKYFSNDRTDPGPELYLSPVSIWEPMSGNWVPLDYADGVLFHGAEISRIEFLKADGSNSPNA